MPRSAKPPKDLVVTSVERLSPGMVLVRFRSDDLSGFAESAFTDRYVKLFFETSAGPVVRTYTALDPDPGRGTLVIDFVVHGIGGVAGPWAAQARPGDRIGFRGPGGGYAPDPSADWHLFVGDESALPAIRAGLAALPEDAVGNVVVQVPGPDHELPLERPDGVTVTWVHGDGLEDAVRALPWREGRVHAFVHGEAEAVMRGVRPYVLNERGVPHDDASISGYWRQGQTEEGFREWKRDLAAAEAAPSPDSSR